MFKTEQKITLQAFNALKKNKKEQHYKSLMHLKDQHYKSLGNALKRPILLVFMHQKDQYYKSLIH